MTTQNENNKTGQANQSNQDQKKPGQQAGQQQGQHADQNKPGQTASSGDKGSDADKNKHSGDQKK
jgi:hypothetical protein